jgi:hypothetical protein
MEQKALLKDRRQASCGTSRLHAVEIAESRAKGAFLEQQNIINVAKANKNTKVVAIFITFDSDEDCDRALQMYRYRGPLLTRCMQSKEKRFDGQLLLARTAPEPMDLIWENLGHGWIQKAARKLASYTLTTAFLLCSFALILQSEKFQAELHSDYGDDVDCGSYTVDPNRPEWSTNEHYEQLLRTHKPTSSLLTPMDIERDLSPTHFNLTGGNTGVLPCFCTAILYSSKTTNCDTPGSCGIQAMTKFEFFDQSTLSWKPLCREWLTATNFQAAMSLISVFTIIAINLGLKLVLRKLVQVEGPETQTGAIVSLIGKLFMAMFLNTALLTLLINGSIHTLTGGETYVEGILHKLALLTVSSRTLVRAGT